MPHSPHPTAEFLIKEFELQRPILIFSALSAMQDGLSSQMQAISRDLVKEHSVAKALELIKLKDEEIDRLVSKLASADALLE